MRLKPAPLRDEPGSVGFFARLLACGAAAAAAACVPLPVRHAPAARGTLLDASGAPLPGALVVVRFDASYEEPPARYRPLAWRSVRSGPDGRFRAGPALAPGIEAWPWQRTRARVVVALAEGRLCADEQELAADGSTRIAMMPAPDEEERRASCPPLAGWPAGAQEYAAAWRDLYETAAFPDAGVTPAEQEFARASAFRRSLGFGANCTGPVLDLSLAPDGGRAALLLARGSEVEVQLVEASGERAARRRSLAHLPAEPLPRLAWTSLGSLSVAAAGSSAGADARRPELLAGPLDAPGSARAHEAAQVLWRPETPPASLAGETADEPPALEAADRHDDEGLRWFGRSFGDLQEVDAETGLPRDRLQVTDAAGAAVTLALPGEPCGPEGRFGRPQLRVSADGTRGLDLRFVEGACRALAIDLATGDWEALDGETEAGVCAAERHVPASQLAGALPGYLRELRRLLGEAGLDPAAAFALDVEPGAPARLEAQAPDGRRRTLAAPPFPLATPLRRIAVGVVAGNG